MFGIPMYDLAPAGSPRITMPRHRLPGPIWRVIRRLVWQRDENRCRHCGKPVLLKRCHIDHIRSGKLGTNKFSNLRTLCRRCHVLRADPRHRGLIASALRDGVIGPNWREEVWD
jgi:5-methylcytosine-specific restriction protein A